MQQNGVNLVKLIPRYKKRSPIYLVSYQVLEAGAGGVWGGAVWPIPVRGP